MLEAVEEAFQQMGYSSVELEQRQAARDRNTGKRCLFGFSGYAWHISYSLVAKCTSPISACLLSAGYLPVFTTLC